MRATSLILGVALSFGALASMQATAVVVTHNVAKRPIELANNGLYIVTFDEAPLATYRGGAVDTKTGRALRATNPAAIGTHKLNLRSVESKQYLAYLNDRISDHLQKASVRIGRTLTPKFTYRAALSGMAVAMTPAEASRLRGMPGIQSVSPDFRRHVNTDAGPQWIHADQVWSGVSPYPGTTGSGVVIGVVDTGINRTHPAFSGAGITNPRGQFYGLCVTNPSWCTNKLIGIYDFTTTGSTEANDGVDHVGHGSHTASTAAGAPVVYSVDLGNGSSQNRTAQGVAKGANLIMYKGCEVAGCDGTALVAGLDQAVTDGVDVISYSIGGGLEDPWDAGVGADSQAMLNARAGGAVVVVAAGNEGPNPGTVGSPANAPWVLAVAAATHNRIFGNQLDLSGGNTAPPNGGVLIGAALTGGAGPLPMLHGNPVLCAEGTNTTGTNGENVPAAWSMSTYPGKMVVCDRGIYPRVAKSKNVSLAGGGAMVLLNQASDGESVVADAHVIPSTHLGYSESQALMTWLSSGTGQTGTLEGTKITTLDSQGDLLAYFSSRGPIDVPSGLLKPEVTAPGVDILAADYASNGYAIMSGTSMATPHTAGAAALMMAAHPTWGSNEVISALITTARPTDRIDNTTLGTPFDQGAGTLDLAKAIKAGLSFDVTPAQFTAANPASSGVPHDLNLPSIVNENCFETCSMSRTARNMSGGSVTWNVSVAAPAGAVITPSANTMTLANNATQTLNFAINVNSPSLSGHWVFATVTLHPTSGGLSDQVLPVAIYASATQNGLDKPESDFNVLSESGSRDANGNVATIDLSGLVALKTARFAGTPLVPITVKSATVNKDITPSDAFNSLTQGVTYTTFTVPEAPDHSARTYKVNVETNSPTISDVDLYVGQDANGDGLPSSTETTCTSATSGANEHCSFDVINPGGGAGPITYWALAQNFSGPSGIVNIETSAVPIVADNNTLIATGPGHLDHLQATDAAKVRLIWNDPSFLTGQERRGYVIVSATPGSQTALLPVKLTRTGTLEAAYALANNQPYTLSLAGNKAQDRLYFDVPGNATSVTFTTTNGTGAVDLYLAHVPYQTNSDPVIPAAPARGSAQAKATTASPNETITLTGAALLPGRWYVTPVNTGSSVATTTVTVKINSGTAPTVFNGTAFYDPLRSGSGIYLNTDRNGFRDMDWYTYLEDQTPVWYGGSFNPVSDNSGQIYADVLRITDDGTSGSHNATKVGNATISMINDTDLVYSYNINGESGSAPMTRLGLHNCPTLNSNLSSTTGIWYPPSRDGIGDSIIINWRDEYYGIYLYDGQGNPRWASAEKPFDGSASRTLPAVQLKGACPQCSQIATSETPIGTVSRDLVQNGISSVGVNLTFAAPIVPQAWSVTAPVSRLSVQYACPAQ